MCGGLSAVGTLTLLRTGAVRGPASLLLRLSAFGSVESGSELRQGICGWTGRRLIREGNIGLPERITGKTLLPDWENFELTGDTLV